MSHPTVISSFNILLITSKHLNLNLSQCYPPSTTITTTSNAMPTCVVSTPISTCNTSIDLMIVYLNSCGLNAQDFNVFLDGVYKLVASFMDNTDPHTCVRPLKFDKNDDTHQNNAKKFINKIKASSE